ncbi:LOW QUALITY PROTEIN: atos homolog protein A [Aplochiton taeniatus]
MLCVREPCKEETTDGRLIEDPVRGPEETLMTLDNMKPERDASEEFFEYDAEEFLVFRTLCSSEGRTPECSVKGRTEGLHAPPSQSALPSLFKHECSDKLPQCRRARRTRSEVMLLWRTQIPIMIEVMLLPDCCYGERVSCHDPVSDPAIKRDALLLERWTLQPVQDSTGDRFIEEKTLLLAVRSYVFFSQLSAWLSASHGIVPRNIPLQVRHPPLLPAPPRVPSTSLFLPAHSIQIPGELTPDPCLCPTGSAAADEDLVWSFSQPPSEHLFPVPRVPERGPLRVRVQSLPRQPHSTQVLTCSIHTALPPLYSKSPHFNPGQGLPLYKRSQDPKESLLHNPNLSLYSKGPTPISNLPLTTLPVTSMPLPGLSLSGVPLYTKRSHEPVDGHGHGFHNGELPQVHSPHRQGSPLLRRASCSPTRSRSPLPPGGKAVRWLYSALNGPSDTPHTEDYGSCTNGAESSKRPGSEPLRAFKNLSLADPPRCPSPRPNSSETNPLIGSLLQERQEVIARIAQRLNFCDPTAPPLPPLFMPDAPPKGSWATNHEEVTLNKTKEPDGLPSEPAGHVRPSPFDTPVSDPSFRRRESSSPKPAACRRLGLTDTTEKERDRDSCFIAQAVQDITKLIQDRLSTPSLSPTNSRSSSPLQHTHITIMHTLRTYTNTTHASQTARCSPSNGYTNGHTPSHNPPTEAHPTTPAPVCTDKVRADLRADCPNTAQNGAHVTLEDPPLKLQSQTGQRLQTFLQEEPQTRTSSSSDAPPPPTRRTSPKPSPSPRQGSSPLPLRMRTRLPQAQLPPAHPKPQPPPPSCEPKARPRCGPATAGGKKNRHSLDATLTKAFHPCTGLPLLSSPVPQRKTQTGYFDLDTSLVSCKDPLWASGKRVCVKREEDTDDPTQLFSASAPPASLSLLGNFEECVVNNLLEPLGTVEGFTAEVGARNLCPSHMTLPVDVSFYSVSDDAPSPYMGVIKPGFPGQTGYRVPPSGTIQVTLFNPNKTVVKMFVVVYDLRALPAGHQTFLRQRTFSVPVRRDAHNRKPLPLGQGRTLRYLIHLRFQSSKSGKIYLHRDIRLLFSRKSMEVDSGAAYELQSFTESPADPPFSHRC